MEKPSHPRFNDIEGQRFDRLVAMRLHSKSKHGYYWLCRCDCGGLKVALAARLLKGYPRSCGCLARETSARNIKGVIGGRPMGRNPDKWVRNQPEYRAWCGIKDRCYRKTNGSYGRYGGRGVSVCTRWLDSYENFLSDMGPRPSPYHSLDRIDNAGDYEPSNCRWATRKTQARNRRSIHHCTINGVTKPLAEWADEYGADLRLARQRIKVLGWDPERALTAASVRTSRPTP